MRRVRDVLNGMLWCACRCGFEWKILKNIVTNVLASCFVLESSLHDLSGFWGGGEGKKSGMWGDRVLMLGVYMQYRGDLEEETSRSVGHDANIIIFE